ncbi:DNA-deoxyinosine glycosylase [Dokdonella soli]|uniref:DNA-deoxyinosine glycosylase n=1 Tax=Dokdonella soli TaxID=529810 RepID=A0ABP3TQR8_9GAMM
MSREASARQAVSAQRLRGADAAGPQAQETMTARAARVSSFPPQVGADCRVLMLGTVPSLRSLAMRQSYAHPHNLFWPFMGELFDAGPELPYAERIARLHAVGIGIWDVLRDCERSGSLDSSIRVGSEIANDIPGLLDAHPTITAIALNGAKAQQVFARRIAPRIETQAALRVEILALPSTSPANASIPRAAKLERWRAVLRWTKPCAVNAPAGRDGRAR